MNAYYQIISLSGDAIQVKKNKLVVNLDRASLENPIESDRIFLDSTIGNSYFWVSGGGTYLVNNQYLIVVKRSNWAKVNPQKYSLFTGRADSISELTQPDLLVRELFEELLITTNNYVYYPKYFQYQEIIDFVYQDLKQRFDLNVNLYKDLNLNLITEFNQDIDLRYKNTDHHFYLNFHINSKNDINILFLFSSQLDISNLSAQDCEYHLSESGELIKHNREIYLYDLIAKTAQGISSNTNKHIFHLAENQMTEHLQHMVSQLKP